MITSATLMGGQEHGSAGRPGRCWPRFFLGSHAVNALAVLVESRFVLPERLCGDCGQVLAGSPQVPAIRTAHPRIAARFPGVAWLTESVGGSSCGFSSGAELCQYNLLIALAVLLKVCALYPFLALQSCEKGLQLGHSHLQPSPQVAPIGLSAPSYKHP